ncbi:MAG: methyl-accepting chemotaxis protein [Candidatus Thiodiazotropha sp. (ex Monitilora ramsayi)]|nr:methyl-accepting chemotaxis protein [Candidatus Thiodiazotropha sp. (ex Monitilora ramsayi)]
MKNNQPVTQHEVEVKLQQNILSTTDLKGAISYINSDFIEISGFDKTELIGKNHNVVRHPDMPPIAFKNLWETVKSGHPWMGIVKNRCKNGDHYWVDAFVMPIKQDGKTVEYQSVRYRPEREWVDRAQPIYKRLLEGKGYKPSLGSRMKLSGKLMIGNLLALLPLIGFAFSPALSSLLPIGVLLTALLSIGVNFWLMRPFHQLASQAGKIFDQPVMRRIYTGRDDEIGQIQLAMKMQSSQINAIIGRITDTTKNLSCVAQVTSETSDQAHQGVEAQQTELSQVATAMTEMVATVQEIARNASHAAESTVKGQHETGNGNAVVGEAIQAINSLADELQKASDVVGQLSEQSMDIVKVLEVIKGIAEQTNLLALNAAIEAARAGENGRGFAVVADEVRTLAGRTTESASEIEQMIEVLQSGSHQAVAVMDESRNKAGDTVALAANAGRALDNLSEVMDAITDMSQQIATASEEQSAVAEEINQSIVNINQIAESTSQGAQKSVSATDEMVGAIRRLDNLVTQFRH